MNWLQRKLMHARIFLGVPTQADLKERDKQVLQGVTDYINALDRRDTHDDTPAERPSRK